MNSKNDQIETSPISLPEISHGEGSSQRSERLFGWYHLGFAFDDIIVILLFVLAFLLSAYMKPFERPIDVNDVDLSHPHLENFVPNWLLVLVAIVIPTLLGLLWYSLVALVRRMSLSDALYSAHLFAVGILCSVALTELVTDFTKNWAGRLRPDFLSRCQYNATLGLCTGDAALINDGRKSFPSGHACMSFAGLGFLAFWIFGLCLNGIIVKSQLNSTQATCKPMLEFRPFRLWRFVLPTIPLLVATFVAISRTQQYVHHPTDVIAGSILGLLISAMIYFIYYNHLSIKDYGKNYSAVSTL